ncbi:MAG: DNA repair protein RecN [Bacteroidales bacterium]|nr:DNA repair protein RecN [Bacteroidales bacterium]
MIRSLHIKNFILIRELEISFSDGLNVITGETGAGKSIILGAIALLAGKRAESDVLFDSDQKCVLEGHFHCKNLNLESFFEENELDFEDIGIVRREIGTNGKSRAFINDTPVNLSVLKAFSERMLNIHSQHESLLIAGSVFQLNTIDSYAGNHELLKSYRNYFFTFKSVEEKLNRLKEENQRINSDLDYYNFLFDELEAARISKEDFGELEQDHKWLSNAGKINEALSMSVFELTESEQDIIGRLRRIEQELSSCADFHEEIKDLSDRISQAQIEISDISDSLQSIASKSDFSENRMEEVSTRLDEYNRLMHKHKVSDIDELLHAKAKIEGHLSASSDLDIAIEKLETEKADLFQKANKEADNLHEKRETASKQFALELKAIIADLGMPDAEFTIEITENEFNAEGKDKLRFLFNANKGGKVQPLSQVASGGEISRVMLAIKSMIAERRILPTIIFDEIDSGVSGKMAAKMGNILQKMASSRQILAVTHLPQIAARGQEHIHVIKENDGDKARTQMLILNQAERIEEIAKMLGDENTSENAREMAKELLSD